VVNDSTRGIQVSPPSSNLSSLHSSLLVICHCARQEKPRRKEEVITRENND
jgi:hypothetical protein